MFTTDGSKRDNMISDYFSFVFKSFIHRSLRSWLTVIGIFIGIAAVVALISLGQGVQYAVTDVFAGVGTNLMIVTPGGFTGPGSGLTTSMLTQDDADVIENVRGVDHVAPVVSNTVRVVYKDQTKFISVLGFPTDKETIEFVNGVDLYKTGEGRFLKSNDKYDASIGYLTSKEKFNKEIGVGDKIELNGQAFSVVGIREKSGSPVHDSLIAIPIDVARDIINEPEEVSMIFVMVKDNYNPSKVKLDVEEALRKERDVEEGKEDFDVTLSEELISSIGGIIDVVQYGLVGIASISLVVGAIGIMNTMYTAVADRTKEIGIMKAIGATNGQITLIFLIESGMLGLIGGVVGIIVGIILSKTVEYFAAGVGFDLLKASVTVELIVFALGFSFLIGALSGVLPARAASKLKPVEAIRKW